MKTMLRSSGILLNGHGNRYSEKNLETAILKEQESLILEMRTGFAFVARQKRPTIDSKDYYLDQLFYHQRLRSLIVLELKRGEFRTEYKGQLELYFHWLDR